MVAVHLRIVLDETSGRRSQKDVSRGTRACHRTHRSRIVRGMHHMNALAYLNDRTVAGGAA